MNREKKESTLFIIGSGFSVNLGLLTTERIGEAIDIMCDDSPLEERLKRLQEKLSRERISNFDISHLRDVFHILLDADRQSRSIREVEDLQEKAIRKIVRAYINSFPDGDGKAFFHYLKMMPKRIDWIAFKNLYSLYRNQKKLHKEKPSLVEFLTLLSKAQTYGIALPMQDGFISKGYSKNLATYMRSYNVYGAFNFYRYFFFKIFKLLMQKPVDTRTAKKYYFFLKDILSEYRNIPNNSLKDLTNRNWFTLPVKFLTFNWDPFLPFILFKVNRNINYEEENRALEYDLILQFYTDIGISGPVIYLAESKDSSEGYHLATDDMAFQVNYLTKRSYTEKTKILSNVVYKLTKLYAVHGLFNLRMCPHCHQVFFIMPTRIRDTDIYTLKGIQDIFLSDLIPSQRDFRKVINKYKRKYFYEPYKLGKPDMLLCPVCNYPTYFEDIPLSVQTIFKLDEPDFLKKTKLKAFTEFIKANHIIVIGYSFPQDDMLNNYLLQLLSISPEIKDKKEKKISVIIYNSSLRDKVWYKLSEIEKVQDNLEININFLKNFFIEENIRISFLGFPDILKKINFKEILNFY